MDVRLHPEHYSVYLIVSRRRIRLLRGIMNILNLSSTSSVSCLVVVDGAELAGVGVLGSASCSYSSVIGIDMLAG